MKTSKEKEEIVRMDQFLLFPYYYYYNYYYCYYHFKINHINKLFLIISLPNDKFYTLQKLKEFADDNFRFDETGGKFFKRVENTVGKEEIACYEQFLLFPQCFQKTSTADT